MKKRDIKGILPALITPFTSEGEIDRQKLRAFLKFLVPQVDGLYVCGSYGSGPLMSSSQRMRIAEIVTEEVGGSIPVIMHVGTADTRSTLELAKHAESLKVDAIACLTPYYYLHNPSIILAHFRRVIEAVDIPVFLYNNPKYTNYCITAEQIAQLAEWGLGGLKDSSANIGLFYECINSVKNPDFIFLIGSQTLLLPALVGGGHGCVSGLSNLFPKLVKSIFQKVKEGDLISARHFQRKANELRKLTGSGIPIPFYHVALKHRGIDIGVPKAPLMPLSGEEVERIVKALEKYSDLE